MHPLFYLYPDARGHSKGSCNGREYGDENVQDFTPKLFVYHDRLSFKLLMFGILITLSRRMTTDSFPG